MPRNDGLVIPPGCSFVMDRSIRPCFSVTNTSKEDLFIPNCLPGWLKGALMDWNKQGRCVYTWED